MVTAEDVIARLDLRPHPEGGHYRETFRDTTQNGDRGAITAIYYLLAAGERSHWHRIDAVEIWHYYAGASIELLRSPDGRSVSPHLLGGGLAEGVCPQLVVPKGCWQSARSLGAWTLVGCTVSPAFEFAGFELAPRGWSPGAAHDAG
ncbi:MAG TPA: cupin domain-containing protein [Alphaproteobacteria bacterium]|nr:cupin domain-containing protein [Alphaproteobacteria bacterium]